MTSRRAVARAAALLTAITLGTTGCGNGESSETPTTTTEAQPWDPCTLSDETLQKAGLDPATEGPGSVEAVGEETCSWKNDDIGAMVTFTSRVTIEQLRDDPRTLEFQEVTVGGRTAFTQISDLGGDPYDYCYLNVPLQKAGLVTMQVSRSAFTKDTTPMCEWAVQVGDVLAAEMPD